MFYFNYFLVRRLCLAWALFLIAGLVSAADIYVRKSSIDGLSPSCADYTIDFVGDIFFGDGTKLEKQLKSIESKFDSEACRNGFLMIRIHSNGGDALEAIKVGRIVRKYNLHTVITPKSQCLSSCVFLLAGGVRRLVLGSVGIHRPYFASLDSKLSIESIKAKRTEFNRQIYEFLEEVDVSKNLLDTMLSVPPESVRYLTEDELQSFRLSIDDASYDEKMVSSKAYFYNITSAEYRRRLILSNDLCGSFNSTKKYAEYELCRESTLTGLNRAETKRRIDKIWDVCDTNSNSKVWIDCRRSVLVFGR